MLTRFYAHETRKSYVWKANSFSWNWNCWISFQCDLLTKPCHTDNCKVKFFTDKHIMQHCSFSISNTLNWCYSNIFFICPPNLPALIFRRLHLQCLIKRQILNILLCKEKIMKLKQTNREKVPHVNHSEVLQCNWIKFPTTLNSQKWKTEENQAILLLFLIPPQTFEPIKIWNYTNAVSLLQHIQGPHKTPQSSFC